MNHPTDVEYIRKMVPNISDEIIEKQKTLQSGTCLGFGMAFTIPLIVKLKMPDPEPKSGNCDVVNIWNGGVKNNTTAPTINQPTQQSSLVITPSAPSMNAPVIPMDNLNQKKEIEPLITVPIKADGAANINNSLNINDVINAPDQLIDQE